MRLCQWPLPFDLLVFAAFQSALGRRRITWRSLEELSDPKIVDVISVPKHSDQVISGFLPSFPSAFKAGRRLNHRTRCLAGVVFVAPGSGSGRGWP
jgi:hypothetical protein